MAAESHYSDDEDGWQFCTNCTAMLGYDSQCEDCGHYKEQDGELLDVKACQPMCTFKLSAGEKVALAFDERMTLHEEGRFAPHPERPDRIMAIITRLLANGVADRCLRIPCREAKVEELRAVHTSELVSFVQAASEGTEGLPMVPPDTYINSHTHMCARLAAGSAAEVATSVARGEASHGAAIVRPPGHHAESGMAMGFCFFNNAAVAARAAQAAGAQRILILDWDVHHGNGTQHIFENDPSVLFMSLHRHDGGSFYPGTGAVNEVGHGAGQGYTVNVPWNSRDMGDGDYLSAFQLLLMPIAYEFNPDLIIVSAGFDAAEGDPIGECRLTPECFAHMTAMLKSVAPCVLLLEGGYNLRSTAMATEACLRVLLGEQPPSLPGARHPSLSGWQSIRSAIEAHAGFWMSLCHAVARNPSPPSQLPRPLLATVSSSDGDSHFCSDGNNERAQNSDEVVASKSPISNDLDKNTTGSDPSNSGLKEVGRSLKRSSLPRKQQIMLSIHRRAMRSFWRRRRSHSYSVEH
eukprot:gene2356-8664_t